MKYIYENEIKEINGTTVTFTNDKVVEFTEKELDIIVSDEPQKEHEARAKLVQKIAIEINSILEQYNIKKTELDPIISVVVESYNVAFKKALGIAFGTYDADRHHDYYAEDIKITDITRLIKSI